MTAEELFALQNEESDNVSAEDIIKLQDQKEPTLEEKYVTPITSALAPIGSAVEPLLDIAGKAGAVVGRGINQAYNEPDLISKPGAFLGGAKEEMMHTGITPESSMTNIAMKYPEMHRPFFQQEMEVFKNSPFAQQLAQQFPNISNQLKNVQYGHVMGGMGDVALQGLGAKGLATGIGAFGSVLEAGAESRALKNIGKIIELRTSAPQEYQRLVDSGQMEELKRLAYRDPMLLNQPKKVLDYLQGGLDDTTTSRGAKDATRRFGGQLEDASSEQKNLINSISSNPELDANVDLNQVSAQAKGSLGQNFGRGSDFSSTEIPYAQKQIDKSLDLRSVKEGILSDINQGRRASGVSSFQTESKIPKNIGSTSGPSTENLATGLSPEEGIQSNILAGGQNTEIPNNSIPKQSLSGGDSYFSSKKAAGIIDQDPTVGYKYHTAQEYIDDIYKKNIVSLSEAEDMKRRMNKQITDLVQDRLAGGEYNKATDVGISEAKKAIQVQIDDIMKKTLGDAKFQEYLARERDLSNYQNFQDVFKNARARNIDNLGKYIPVGNEQRGTLRTALNAGQDMYQRNMAGINMSLAQDKPFSSVNYTPENVVVPSATAQLMMRKGFVENLADFEIPRSADEILKNKQLVLAKIAQSTNDPRAVAVLEDVLNKHPDKLGSALPALIANPAMTNLFKVNKYQSWVNGRILDPMEQQKAYKEVTDRKISNTEKSILWDGLNRDGSFPESF